MPPGNARVQRIVHKIRKPFKKPESIRYKFQNYLNPIFIETGSFKGLGIESALKFPFEQVISIEISKYYYEFCKGKFADERVKLYNGDSSKLLPKILKGIDKKCTFWLDAHLMLDYYGGLEANTAYGKNPFPLIAELNAIKEHMIKDHTIIIDDIRLIRKKKEGWENIDFNTDVIEQIIKSINPDYKIQYHWGMVRNDILVAKV